MVYSGYREGPRTFYRISCGGYLTTKTVHYEDQYLLWSFKTRGFRTLPESSYWKRINPLSLILYLWAWLWDWKIFCREWEKIRVLHQNELLTFVKMQPLYLKEPTQWADCIMYNLLLWQTRSYLQQNLQFIWIYISQSALSQKTKHGNTD